MIRGNLRCLFPLLLLVTIGLKAQQHSTRETKIVGVISAVEAAEPFLEIYSFSEDQPPETYLQKFPDSQVYQGVLKGGFEMTGIQLKPTPGTEIILYQRLDIYRSKKQDITGFSEIGKLLKNGTQHLKVITAKGGEIHLKAD